MGQYTHKGSRENLLGKDPGAESIRDLSNELRVTSDTPRCFIFHTWDDPVVPVENSLMFAAALRQAGVQFDLHIYQHGPHGIGLGAKINDPSHWHPWTRDCQFWLVEQEFGKK